MVKNLPSNAGDMGPIPDLGRSQTLQSTWVSMPQPLRAHALEPRGRNYWSACGGGPCSGTREAAAARSSGAATREEPSLSTEKSPHSNQDPAQPKTKSKLKVCIFKKDGSYKVTLMEGGSISYQEINLLLYFKYSSAN